MNVLEKNFTHQNGTTEYVLRDEAGVLGFVCVDFENRAAKLGGGHERVFRLSGAPKYEGRGWRDRLIADAEKMLRDAVGGAF